MVLKYKGNVILENDNIDLLEKTKLDFSKVITDKYSNVINKLNELSDIGKYLPANEGDILDKEYFDKIKKYNPYFLILLEEVSSEIFSDKDLSNMKIYIRNPKTGMYGVIIDDKKYSHTKMSMIVREKLPLKSDFEIC